MAEHEPFWESSDVAKEFGLTAATVRQHANAGHIHVSGSTVRGNRLFSKEDVDAYREWRDSHGRKQGDTWAGPA